MKIILVLTSALTIIILYVYYFLASDRLILPRQDVTTEKTVSVNPTATLPPENSIQINNTIYVYNLFRVKTPYRISLIPNFRTRELSTSVFASNSCKALINGGFYDTENNPLGLFRINNKIYSPVKVSKLLDGFIRYQEDSGLTVDFSQPDGTDTWVMQTGPILFYNGKPLKLSIKNDEPARRSLLAVTQELTVVIMSVSIHNQNKSGPLLSDLPEILTDINKKEKFNISNAINLDGGSASAFISGQTELEELTNVGSFLCFR